MPLTCVFIFIGVCVIWYFQCGDVEMVKTFYSVVIYNHHLKKVPVILVKLMRFNAILWFASTADRNNACARTGWPLATHYIQKHILFSCFRLRKRTSAIALKICLAFLHFFSFYLCILCALHRD